MGSNEKEQSIITHKIDESHKTFPSYEVQKQAKVSCAVRNKDSGYLGVRLVTGSMRGLLGDWSCSILDLEDEYTSVFGYHI